MKTFRYDVTLVVEAQGFDHFDVEELIRDTLGLGDVCGLLIVESAVGEFVEVD